MKHISYVASVLLIIMPCFMHAATASQTKNDNLYTTIATLFVSSPFFASAIGFQTKKGQVAYANTSDIKQGCTESFFVSALSAGTIISLPNHVSAHYTLRLLGQVDQHEQISKFHWHNADWAQNIFASFMPICIAMLVAKRDKNTSASQTLGNLTGACLGSLLSYLFAHRHISKHKDWSFMIPPAAVSLILVALWSPWLYTKIKQSWPMQMLKI